MRWLPLALIVLSNVAYHLGQKAVPRGAHPVVAALAMYAVAAAGGLVALLFVVPGPTRASAAAALHWSVALVGLGILGVEIGFLLVYRAGWEISTASLVAAVLLAMLLVPIGIFGFREPWSATRLAGLVLALSGLWLLGRG
jgi:drug/metabolite transporter (DMT)-like permease